MQAAFWKVAALLTVIGTGCLGVYQVQKNLNETSAVAAQAFPALGEEAEQTPLDSPPTERRSDTSLADVDPAELDLQVEGQPIRGQNASTDDELWAASLDNSQSLAATPARKSVAAATPRKITPKAQVRTPTRTVVAEPLANENPWADAVEPAEVTDSEVLTADHISLDEFGADADAVPQSQVQSRRHSANNKLANEASHGEPRLRSSDSGLTPIGRSNPGPVLMPTPNLKRTASRGEVQTVAGERTRGSAAAGDSFANETEGLEPVTPESLESDLGVPDVSRDFRNPPLSPLGAPDSSDAFDFEPDNLALEPTVSEPAPFDPGPDELLPVSGEPDLFNQTPTRTVDPVPNASTIPAEPAGRTTIPNLGNPLDTNEVPTRKTPRQLDLRGDSRLDPAVPTGPQQPELKIEKIAPEEATVGDEMVYVIRVQNVGRSTAFRVKVEDGIPWGSDLIGSDPMAVMPVNTGNNMKKLVWDHIESLAPGESREIKVKVRPTETGAIGSVATVSFAASVGAKTTINAPKLAITVAGQQEAAIGEQVPLKLRITNTGSGSAKDVKLFAELGKLLTHASLSPEDIAIHKNSLDNEIGTLGPNQSRDVELVLTATNHGEARPTFSASINGNESSVVQESHDVVILPARLHIARTGPTQRFVGRAGTFLNTVTNLSRTETLQNVTVYEKLPVGLEPNGQTNGAKWDATNRLLTWQIPKLGPQENVPIQYTLIPKKDGEYTGIVQASDTQGNKATVETALGVAGFADLVVDMHNNGTNVAVGDQVSLRLTVKNQGTADARDVEALFELPPELKYVSSNPPQQVVGQNLSFSVERPVAPGEDITIDVVLAAAKTGNVKVKAELHTADNEEPFRSEAPIRIHLDDASDTGPVAAPLDATGDGTLR